MRTISTSSSGSEEEDRSLPASPLQPSLYSLLASVNQEIWLTERGGVLSTDDARLSGGGPAHKVVISFLDEVLESARLRLAIDDQTVHEVQTSWSFQGNVKLELDGLVVDFVWETIEWPVWFWFRTRAGGNGEPGSDEEELWEEIEVAHSLVINGRLN